MPLSEHEKQVLAEIERQLAADDPRFVARTRKKIRKPQMRSVLRRRIATVLAVLGVPGLLMLGVLPGPWNLVVSGTALAALLVAVLLGVSSTRKETSLTGQVPPDDRR